MFFQIGSAVLFFLICDITTGYRDVVKCYSCSSKDNESCIKPAKHNMQLVRCGMDVLEATRKNAKQIDQRYDKLFEVDSTDAGRIDLVCLKVVAKDGNKDYIIRGCQLAEQSHLDICKKLQEQNSGMVKAVHCSKCTIDGCNSSRRIEFSLAVAFISFLFTSYI